MYNKNVGTIVPTLFFAFFICILEVPADNPRTPRSMRQVYTEPTQSFLVV